MRHFGLRLIASLTVALTMVVLVALVNDTRGSEAALRDVFRQRAARVAGRLQTAVAPVLDADPTGAVSNLLDEIVEREQITGAAIYAHGERLVAASGSVTDAAADRLDGDGPCPTSEGGCDQVVWVKGRPLYSYLSPGVGQPGAAPIVAVFLEAGVLAQPPWQLWSRAAHVIVPQVLLTAIITLLVVRRSVATPLSRTIRWLRDVRIGRAGATPGRREGGLFEQLSAEAEALARRALHARATAETEARLRESGGSVWTPDRLKVHMTQRLNGSRLFVVSNREPYEHVWRGRDIQVITPASGLVTAIEPVLHACDGTWVAHASGSADRAVVDAHDRVRVPEDGRYTLRRVWLTAEEEGGYYRGFSNEGLWPLCHMAHARPIFRADDWYAYGAANRRFAAATLAEMAGVQRPMLLVQDYHFALLPQMVAAARRDVRMGIFWHIPWPNPDAFAICPWGAALLEGMLAADIVGFHVQAYCHNFLETVDRTLECRIDWDRCTVVRRGHTTAVRPYPIRVATEASIDGVGTGDGTDTAALRARWGGVSHVGVGVDRLDYTKGLVERLLGIERFFLKYPRYQGQAVFVQVAAPTRAGVARYAEFECEVRREADRINRRLQAGGWVPVHLLERHHSRTEIVDLYRAADVCLVTSLHDGMNLVAKEFVASRDDEDGVLVLSRFCGASHELVDALEVNPYDTERMADIIRLAFEMPAPERRERMRHMRAVVRSRNVYRWAADIVADVAAVRPPGDRALSVR